MKLKFLKFAFRLITGIQAVLLHLVLCAQQPGSLDTSFNSSDVGFGFGNYANQIVNSIILQPDGKIIIMGAFTSFNGTSRRHIARLNADGNLDNSFNPGTGPNSTVSTVALQIDGKIIIGGNFTSYNGTSRNRIARLNSDGSLDTSFNPGSGTDQLVRTTAIQPDGKIIIGGAFNSYNGISRNRIARLNTDGSLDTSFDPGLGADDHVATIVLQSDGKIIIRGLFTSYNGTSRNEIARLNTDGSLDSSFNPGTGPNSTVSTVALQIDGKIIIGGGFTSYNGISRNRIARLNVDGSLDTSFNTGTGASNVVRTITLQPDGKIIIGGSFTSYNGTVRNRIARLNSDGSLDTTFNPGAGSSENVETTTLQGDGKIIIGGWFTSFNGTARNHIARLNTNGSLDTDAFNDPGTGANNTILTSFIQPDGKIFIGGYFSSYNGSTRPKVTRVNSDGSLDASFDPGTGPTGFNASPAGVSTSIMQSDGKIFIGGRFTTYNGTARNRIARLNSDGSLDSSFNPGLGPNELVETTAIQPDGKIIIGGAFNSYNGISRNRIARLNSDGSLDTSFDPGLGADSYVLTIVLQSDGKIIIGGLFTSYNGTSRNRIARLNSDGSLDSSFNPGTGANSDVQTISLQSDGKIIIGGWFTSYNGTTINYITRLNSNGSLDTSFNSGTGANSFVYTTALQSNGKIIIGGWFTSYNGISRSRIARLNADGSLDTCFDPGTGLGGDGLAALTSVLQSDDKILIGGRFTSYNGIGRNHLTRIFGGESIISITSFTPSNGPIGTPVTITGNCFSITPANNTVRFNGTLAAVTASTANSITTSVPTGATTGTITVTVAGQTATSVTNFTVVPVINYSLTVDGTPRVNGATVTYTSTTVSQPQDKNFILTNTGDTPITVSSITTNGDYTITSSIPASIPIGATETLTVRFQPTVAGTRTGVFTINSNATIPLFTINLSGQGVDPVPAIEIKTDGTGTPTGSNVQFTSTGVGSSQLKELEIVNTGTAPLIITDIQVTGDFSLAGALPPPIDPGNSAKLSINFAPTNLGQRTGTLTILSNGDIAVYTINLLGEGDAEPEVYNVVTTNPNGKHDFLNIRNITLFPNNRVSIFDRWGNKVFERDSYDNVTNPFTGKSDSGKDLPDGTYYYVIDKNNGTDRITGFLLLRR